MQLLATIFSSLKMTFKKGIASVIILTCLILWNCEKDKVVCSDDELFCLLVSDQNYDSTGTLINDFLTTQKSSKDESLENLRKWLECKSCVVDAKILCNSCLYTYPAMSELSVNFISGANQITMKLDISMSDTLKFITWH